jgi:hypothetical protein
MLKGVASQVAFALKQIIRYLTRRKGLHNKEFRISNIYESSVPVPIHVDESEVEQHLAPDLIETSVRLVVGLDHLSVSPVAEGGIC